MLDKALSLDPNEGPVYTRRGIIRLVSGETDRALADFRTAEEKGGASAVLFFNMGKALAVKNDLDDALRYLNRSIELNPNLRNIQYVRGLVRWAKGHKDEAELDFKEAVERDSSLAGPRKTLDYFIRTKLVLRLQPLPPKKGTEDKEDNQ